MRRAVRVLLAVVTVAAVLFLFVFPVRTLVDQRDQTAQAEQRVKGLQAENAQLAREATQLKNNAVIEQLARQRFGLVMPGDHAYTILPRGTATGLGTVISPTTTTVAPSRAAAQGG